MKRHLRMAGVGLCAALLPACSMNGKLTDDTRPVTPGYVVMPRPTTSTSTGLRQQLQSGSDSAQAKSFGPNADLLAAEAPKISTKPPTDLAVPPIPEPPGKNVRPVAAAEAAGTKDAEVLPAVSGLKTAEAAVPAPVSDEPVRVPDWPEFNMPAAPVRPTRLPDAALPVEPASATGPVSSTTTTPPAAVTAPPLPQLESSTSLKLSTPSTPNFDPAPAPALEKSAPAPAVDAMNETVLFQALRAFQKNQPQEAHEHLRRLDAGNQELLMYLMPLMVRLAEGDASALPPEELATMIDRLQTASTMLKSRASLRVDRLSFCKGVRRFGDFDLYEAGHEFRPGDVVFLYLEPKNFTCELVAAQGSASADGPAHGWRIRLAPKLEIRDANNNLVWRTDLNKTDFAQSPPQDYFHTYRFAVPDKLPPGTYTFWLTIVDKPTGRTVRKPVEMRIGKS